MTFGSPVSVYVMGTTVGCHLYLQLNGDSGFQFETREESNLIKTAMWGLPCERRLQALME